jgi:hypothetical protein
MSQDKPWGLCLTARSKKLQEKPLDLQFNSQDVFGYMLLPKESQLSFNVNVQDSTLSSLYQCIVYPDHFWAAAAPFLKTKWINSSSVDQSSKEIKTQSPKNKETWYVVEKTSDHGLSQLHYVHEMMKSVKKLLHCQQHSSATAMAAKFYLNAHGFSLRLSTTEAETDPPSPTELPPVTHK